MDASTPTVLFADTDLVWSRPIRNELRRRGARVLVATTVRRMLDLVWNTPVGLLVLDGTFDPIGVTLLVSLVRKKRPDVKVILVSAPPSGVVRESAAKLGIEHCEEKPVDETRFLDHVTEGLGLRAPDSPRPTSGLVVCVDDDAFYLRCLSRILTRHGYRVLSFDDPSRALGVLGEVQPDVAILDCLMPGMSGLHLAERIRRGRGSRIPLIMLTCRDSDQDILEGYRHGVSYYLTKPCEPRTVLNVVDYFAGGLEDTEKEIVERQL